MVCSLPGSFIHGIGHIKVYLNCIFIPFVLSIILTKLLSLPILVLPAFAQPDLPRSQGCPIQLSRLYPAKLQGDISGIHWRGALPNLHNHMWWPRWAWCSASLTSFWGQ